jgi:hypothetical protein
MSTTETNSTEYAIWSRLLQPGKPTFSPAVARAVLALDFPPEDKARLRELAAKAREGTLTPEEQEQIDSYGRVGSVLSILKSKARVSLRKAGAGNGSGR